MRCQKCNKPATYHITEIEKPGKFQELHFCDEHALQHLAPSGSGPESLDVGQLAKGLISSGQAAPGPKEAASQDKVACPNCHITYADFKNSGRLGCPQDYEVFRDDLMPLLESIHGETRHCGKVPRRAPRNAAKRTELIRLRNLQKQAIADEDYEAAAGYRDQIRALEEELEP